MPVYALALGSNRPAARTRGPVALIGEAVAALSAHGSVVGRSPTIATAPIGPAGRRFANAVILLETMLPPPALLAAAKAIERGLGRRAGRRWGMRTIDIDLVLWSAGRWRSRRPTLAIPHALLERRTFVLVPLLAIAPGWRVPPHGRTVRHLATRLTRARAVHRSRRRSGP